MFDLRKESFSRNGSYMAISYLKEGDFKRFHQEEGLYLRSLHTYSSASTIFRIDFLKENITLDYTYKMTPTELVFNFDEGEVSMCYPNENQLQIKGSGVDISLLAVESNVIDHLHKVSDGSVAFNSYLNGLKINARAVKGYCDLSYKWDGWFCENNKIFTKLDEEGHFEITLSEYESTFDLPEKEQNYGACLDQVSKDFSDYVSRYSGLTDNVRAKDAIEKAAYVNWSSVVAENGWMTRRGMLMSKNWMNKLWAWDHCFNAMALSNHDKKDAWDQMMVVFDNQHADGSLPDVMSDGYISRAYYKLPVHGWALKEMMKKNDFSDKLEEIYEPLSRWTHWWLHYRVDKKTGLIYYFHNNESGWDNGSVFNDGGDVITPELNAFLILQLECLRDVAKTLGLESDAAKWQEKMLSQMVSFEKHLIVNHIVTPITLGEERPVTSQSLMPLETIILGNRLDSEVLKNMVIGIGKHIEPQGLVTEQLDSPLHNGIYWRGPIWAPATFIVINGLVSIGENELAYKIAKNFTVNCIKNGFSENFDSKTGRNNADGAYTWTSSVFLMLVEQYKDQLQEDSIL